MSAARSLKVLLVGHACSPRRGSEPGVTWNWAWHLAARHQVVVVAHPEYRDEVERFVREHPNPNLRFVWVGLPPRWDPWDPRRGGRGIKLHYVLWQRRAIREAVRLHRDERFDLAHYVSWNTVSEPPPLWRLPIPFVWGPVGGGQTAPPGFRRYFGPERAEDLLRTLRLRLLPMRPALRRAVRTGALILATNRETARLLEAAGAPDVRFFLDCGIAPAYLPPDPPARQAGPELTLLWAGKLLPKKALPLALEALARAADVPARLVVAGEGPQRGECEQVASRLGVERRVRFLGHVSWERLSDVFLGADAFVFTGLRDAFGSVVLEAMAHALPVLALRHQGVGLFVPDDAGIKVPVGTPSETVEALADGIRRLWHEPDARLRMGMCAFEFARSQSWDRRAERMSAWYEECVSRSRAAWTPVVVRGSGS